MTVAELITYVQDHESFTVEELADAICKIEDGNLTGEVNTLIRSRFGSDVRMSIIKLVLLIRNGMSRIERHLDDIDNNIDPFMAINEAIEGVDGNDLSFNGNLYVQKTKKLATEKYVDDQISPLEEKTSVFSRDGNDDAALFRADVYANASGALKKLATEQYVNASADVADARLMGVLAGDDLLMTYGNRATSTDAGVTFEWNDLAGELGGFSGDSRGFIADEYNCIIGNATRKIWGIYDAIDYQQAIPYLVAGWQALYEEVQRLKRRLGDGI